MTRPRLHSRVFSLLIAVGVWCATVSASAETIVAVVSEASAPELAAAGELFAKRESGHRLVFRSSAQVARATDAELQAWIDVADALLLVAVFGEVDGGYQSVGRVFRDPKTGKLILVESSDRSPQLGSRP